jgi:hypothetical protein
MKSSPETHPEQLTRAARQGAKRNERLALFVAGLGVALGVFAIVMDFVYPSAPGHSAIPFGLSCIGLGVLFGVAMRPLLRKRSREAARMPEEVERRGALVDERLHRSGALEFRARSRADMIFSASLLFVIAGGLELGLFYVLQRDKGIVVGAPTQAGLLLLFGLAAAFWYRWTRRVSYVLTPSSLTLVSRDERTELRFDSAIQADVKLTPFTVKGTTAGFHVLLTLRSQSARIPLQGLIGLRPSRTKPGGELLALDVACWLWTRKSGQLGLAGPPV